MVHLAVFASGTGSNARQIIRYFCAHATVQVSLIVCNRPGAGVLDVAAQEHIAVLMIEKELFLKGDAYINELKAYNIDFIVLAGFLWKIPAVLIAAFPNKIINLHPALLPRHGGKGMYGNRVHEAVIAAGEKQSGISIHYVDEWYDHGNIIFQASCSVDDTDTPASLAGKIHQLEHTHYPAVIEQTVLSAKSSLKDPGISNS